MELNRASLIVLVAEDETLIAMGLEDALRRAGYTVAGIFPTGSSALDWLERHRADAAVLDFCLRDGHCAQLLRELRARGTPILIYSATKVADEFHDVSRLMKPAPFEQVVDALDRLVFHGERVGGALPAMQTKQFWPTH
jgi:DNA-binding NarL/FixJ family response regulator